MLKLLFLAVVVGLASSQYSGSSSYSQPPSYSAPSYPAPPVPSYSAPSYSAPSYSAPSYSAPSYPAPAPSYGSSYGSGSYVCTAVNLGCMFEDDFFSENGTYFYGPQNSLVVANSGLTNEACATYCAANNFPYSATYQGTQCKCGILRNFQAASDASLCNAKCSGNQYQFCGSDSGDYITVSSTTLSCVSSIVSEIQKLYPVTCPPRMDYTWCRSIDDIKYVTYHENIPNLTNEYCAALCARGKDPSDLEEKYWYFEVGFSYSATINGAQCACMYAPSLNPATPTNCNKPCTGNKYQNCGGDGYATVTLTNINCGSNGFF